MADTKIVVGLMGHSFHCTNLGVGALALSECRILKEAAEELGFDLEVICFEAGKGENDYSPCSDVPVILDYYTYLPIKMLKKYKQCDLIIDATGGDSFSDIYGCKIFLVGMYFKFLSQFSGKKVLMAPQTVGPFYRKGVSFLANLYMRRIKRIYLRDEISVKALSSYNEKRARKTADMAFMLPYSQNKTAEGKVGLNVSGLLYDEKSKLLSNDGLDYPLLCEKMIEMLLEHNLSVTLVSHVIGDETTATDNDYYAALKLKEKYPDVELAPRFQNPIDAKSYISGLDFFIGSRMHAVIAAVSSGVPAVPIAYSRKFVGVFEPLGYDVTLDATSMTTQEILEKVTEYVEHREALVKKAEHARDTAWEKLKGYKEFLIKEMQSVKK